MTERKYTSELGDKIWGKAPRIANILDELKVCLIPGSFFRHPFLVRDISGKRWAEDYENKSFSTDILYGATFEFGRAYIYTLAVSCFF